jgi:hypothetical protein
MFGKAEARDDFVLIVYDTKRVAEIDARDSYKGYEKKYPPLAAKYALLVGNALEGDMHIFAQELRSSTYRDEAVWFDTWDNIDAAMAELCRRHPDITLVNKIGRVIDWPWSERSDDPIHLPVGDYRTRRPEWRLVGVRQE